MCTMMRVCLGANRGLPPAGMLSAEAWCQQAKEVRASETIRPTQPRAPQRNMPCIEAYRTHRMQMAGGEKSQPPT